MRIFLKGLAKRRDVPRGILGPCKVNPHHKIVEEKQNTKQNTLNRNNTQKTQPPQAKELRENILQATNMAESQTTLFPPCRMVEIF